VFAVNSSGDSTLEAIEAGMRAVVAQPADEHFLFVVSDANLRRYGITTKAVRLVVLVFFVLSCLLSRPV
jgi:hypothetical protein